MPESQRPSSVLAPVAFERPACPRCNARMMLLGIEPQRPGVDLRRQRRRGCGYATASSPLPPRGVQTSYRPSPRCRHGFRRRNKARHSRYLHNSFHVGVHFGAALVHNYYGLLGCSLPRTDLTGIRFQPQQAFYVQAFDGAVTLTVEMGFTDVWPEASRQVPHQFWPRRH